MRLSKLFSKTRHEAPTDEVSRNAKLLIRAGFIHKELAGVYSLLPLGLRVLRNIERIVREEMNAIGGQEVFLTTLQDPALWEKSNRWNDDAIDNWFKTKLKKGGELGIANTHEEPLAALLKNHVSSYKDLPIFVYQIQTKFRNELRAKSGIMRAREFVMKDLYSFSRSEEEFREFYEVCAASYERIFERVGIGSLTYRTIAAGGSFTDGFTDEFQTVSEAGEDTIYIDKKKGRAFNKEIFNDKTPSYFEVDKGSLVEKKAIEVGNIFPLGTKYSEALGLFFTDKNGKKKPVVMGSYGIGFGRLMGTIAEVLSDEKGLVWPSNIAPFVYHLISLGDDVPSRTHADTVYEKLTKSGIKVLYDDRAVSAGVKFADAELIGIPSHIIVSKKTLEEGKNILEIKNRSTGEKSKTRIEQIVS